MTEEQVEIIRNRAEVERLTKELGSIAKAINDYYENEEDDIPVHDLLDAIMEDAYKAIGGER